MASNAAATAAPNPGAPSPVTNMLSMSLDDIIKQRKSTKTPKPAKKEKTPVKAKGNGKGPAKRTSEAPQSSPEKSDASPTNETQGATGGISKRNKRKERRLAAAAKKRAAARAENGNEPAVQIEQHDSGQQRRRNQPQRPAQTPHSQEAPSGMALQTKRGASKDSKKVGKSTAGCRILVSNLNSDVTEEDIKELFSAVGPLVSAELILGPDRRSAKRADVVFAQMAHAVDAISRYNGVPLDHMPLRITLATERSAAAVNSTARDSSSHGHGGHAHRGPRSQSYHRR